MHSNYSMRWHGYLGYHCDHCRQGKTLGSGYALAQANAQIYVQVCLAFLPRTEGYYTYTTDTKTAFMNDQEGWIIMI